MASGWHGVTINDRSQTITVIYTLLHQQGLHYMERHQLLIAVIRQQ